MKSNLFSKNDLMRAEIFQKDIKVLVELKPEVLVELPKYAFDSLATPTNFQEDSAREKASEMLNIPLAKLSHSIDLSEFFMRQFITDGKAEDDQPEDIAADIVELLECDKGKKEHLIKYFERLKHLSKEKVNLLIIRRKYAHAVLPTLKSHETVVEFRVVFDKEFKSELTIDEYKPNCLGTVPIGLINLKLSGGTVEDISFQTDKHSLHRLINQLLALEKQMNIAESHLNLRSATN